ncbi:YALI0B10384p [Yarrowia lipolytica CLIB122]|uniref:YALI0B10384p n=2 Tax=Yarrowia lipolytica TaxID=4952 RepID=Q6CF44_YARLI|nr:YALI0B10384p [Yarrowia lipolytica CLIB122]AOW01504.1 hypothetical protein YALI1_B14013g [Yarrowia lipolytica]KAB8281077.1 hypothetical protein BKA91DRAFT_36712 [Yarrowia lipolytica]KAE8170307.1 hypothetical protein BKA90DRAFT_38709 [Yarrowia lipolytica]KAJ8052322.1 hypothetical protein LXG23DRAFT_25423 [Yarrowia lipolytica]RMJ01061.1 hypothetical protein BD777DRAFT_139157 [Yarrowia lipolytica]|eukprot:XP_500718.1 YALI0B10384p [Yarrowia lipolytica CLIB122]
MGHSFTYKAPSGEAYAAISPEVLKQYRNAAPAKRDPDVSYIGHDPDLVQPMNPTHHSQVHSSRLPPSPLSPTGRMSVPVYGYGSSSHGPPQGVPQGASQGIPQGYPPPGTYSPHQAVPRSFIGSPSMAQMQKMQQMHHMSQVHSQMAHTQLSPTQMPLSPQAEGYFDPRSGPFPQDYVPVQIQSTVEGSSLRRRNSSKSSKSSKSAKSARSAKSAKPDPPRRASTTPSLRPSSLSQTDIELYESPAVGKLISVLEESVALKKAQQQERTSRSSRSTSVNSSAPTTVSSAASSESTDTAQRKYEAEFLRRVQAKVELRNQKVKQAALLGERGIRLVPPKKPETPGTPKPAGWGEYFPWAKKADEPAASDIPVETEPAFESLAAQYYQDLFQMMRDHDVPAVVGDAIVKGYEEAIRIEKEIKDETIKQKKAREEAERKAATPVAPPVANTPAFLTVIIHGAEEEKDYGYKIPVDSIKTFKEFKNLMILTFPYKAKHWQKECFQVFDETNNYFIMGQFWDKLIKRDTILAVSLTPLPPEKEKEPKDKGKPESPATPMPGKKKKEPSKFSKAIMADFDKKKFNQNTTKMFKKFVEASTRPI